MRGAPPCGNPNSMLLTSFTELSFKFYKHRHSFLPRGSPAVQPEILPTQFLIDLLADNFRRTGQQLS